MTLLERRILDLSYKYQLSHIGSCLTAAGIIDEIYSKKKPDEKFVLSCGHAGLALYVVLEKHFGLDAEQIFLKHGVHPDRDEYIDCSTGSLGQGLPIALGIALADRSRNVYCLISDGECAEGSVYESICVRERCRVDNLKIYCNYNGRGAYREIGVEEIKVRLRGINFIYDTSTHWFMQQYGQAAHYKILNEQEYAQAICH